MLCELGALDTEINEEPDDEFSEVAVEKGSSFGCTALHVSYHFVREMWRAVTPSRQQGDKKEGKIASPILLFTADMITALRWLNCWKRRPM